ncbi:MAG: DUF1634 domain-containing protein [Bdellovibrio sp.]
MNKDEQSIHLLELKVSHVLRSGVIISGCLLCIGWLWNLSLRNSSIMDKFKTYQVPVSFYESFHSALYTNDKGLLLALSGLLILVLLPVIRVFLTGIMFFHNKELRLAWISIFVFIALLGSFFLGFQEGPG